MKGIYKTAVALWCAFVLALPGQAAGAGSDRTDGGFPPELNGTMMPYDFTRTEDSVPWDSDMKPVFINYMARHGARFLSSPKKTEALMHELVKAREEGKISEKGKRFLSLLHKVESKTADNWGALDSIGMEEERTLGRQMYAIAPGLLESGRTEARATYVPRVVMTMYELCHELARCSPDVEITTREGKEFNPLLRYFNTDSIYAEYLDNGPWKIEYDAYAETTTPAAPALTLFTDRRDDKKMQKLTLDMYGVLQSLSATGIPGNPREWFSEEEYAACWKVTNLKHYYQRSVSSVSDIPARAARPLLQDIISAADSALQGKSDVVANLRFGHAETVIPLFALMRLPGCYAPDCRPEDVADAWNDSDVSPLGANLMIVMLRDAEGKDYAAVRLNGEWVSFAGRKVVDWERLRSGWLSYMNM